jgi:hypothetical protein
MPIDPNIALSVKPVQIANPLEQYMQVQQIQQAQNQSRLQDLMYGEKQRDLAADKVQADAMTNGDDIAGALARAGYGSRALSYRKTKLDADAKQVEIDKGKGEADKMAREAAEHQFEMAGQLAAAWAQNPSVNQAGIRAGLASALHSKIISEDIYKAKIGELDAIPDNPATLNRWAKGTLQQVMKAKDSYGYIAPDANTLANNRQSAANAKLQADTSRANNRDNIAKDFKVNGMSPDGTPLGDVETMAQGIANGKLPPLSGFALARPRGQTIMARVMELNPDYDAGDYGAKNAALKGFSTGKEGTALRSFNVAIDHLETLGQMADALDNGDTRALNSVANYFAKQTGAAAPTNFQAVKEIVAKEVVKAIVAGGGGVAEREEISNLMNQANGPKQLKGVIDHFSELMSAQKAGLMDQYQRTTGRTDGEQVFAARRHGDGNHGGNKAPSGPALGAIESGADGKRFRYKGGDPGQASSWEAVR